MSKLTSKAKLLLSNKIYSKVVSHCKITEFHSEEAFRDILKHGVEQYCNVQTSDLYDTLMGDKQELVDYIVSKMNKTFDDIAIQYGYTDYSKDSI